MSKGFALPVVLMVALTTTLMTATMIERFATSRLAIQRQLDGYRDYHAEAGLPELIVAYWRDVSIDRSQMLEIIEASEGPLLTVTARDERVRVWIRPGQGTLPVDFAAMGNETLVRAGALLGRTQTNRPELRRSAGPEQISLQDAELPVLEALAEAVTDDPSLAQRWASEIYSAAGRGDLNSAGDIRRAAESAGLDEAMREQMRSLVTLRPELWSVLVEVESDKPPAGRPKIRRYSALLLENELSANDRSWFVDWHPLDENGSGLDTVLIRRFQERTGR